MFSIRMYCGGDSLYLISDMVFFGNGDRIFHDVLFFEFYMDFEVFMFRSQLAFCWRVDLNHFLMLQSSIWVKGIQAVNGPRNKQVSSSHSGPSTQVVLFGGDKLWGQKGQKIWYPKCPQVGPLGVRRVHILFSCHLRVKMYYMDLKWHLNEENPLKVDRK